MPYIYATQLPGDIVKVGRVARHWKERALAAQTYHVVDVCILGVWRTDNAIRDEKRAHNACDRWHVRNELFRVPTDWPETVHPIVVCLSSLLGTPLPASEYARSGRGGRRLPEWVHKNRIEVRRRLRGL